MKLSRNDANHIGLVIGSFQSKLRPLIYSFGRKFCDYISLPIFIKRPRCCYHHMILIIFLLESGSGSFCRVNALEQSSETNLVVTAHPTIFT